MSGSRESRHNRRGSMWRRWDLHFHTPSSFDYKDKSVTNERIVEALVAKQVGLVAAAVCGADQILLASMEREAGNRITYFCGALEHPQIAARVVDVLDGTPPAFDARDMKYSAALLGQR